MSRPLPALLLLVSLAGCSDPPALLIRIQQPEAGLDLQDATGKLTVELLDGNTGAVEHRRDITPASLGARQRLFEGLDLIAERTYRVRVTASLDSKGTCAASKGRALGVSPTFRHAEGQTALSVWVDCADAASSAGKLIKDRYYHQAIRLSGPGPHGQVVLVGGATPRSDADHNSPIKSVDSIEVYDPAKDRFTKRSDKLSRARAFHQAVRLDDRTLISLGGLDSDASGTANESLSHVDRVSSSAVSRIHDLAQKRAVHQAVLLEEQGKVLVVGGFSASFVLPVTTMEIFDPTGQGKPPKLPSLSFPRYVPAVVPFERGRKVLIAGGLWVQDKDLPIDLLCLAGTCPCGAPPCIQQLPGFGMGAGRYSLTGTLVPCQTGGGAVYLVGGHHIETTPVKKSVYYNDIRCVDTANTGKGPVRLGGLLKARSVHTSTLVRGPKGGRRLFVAGGSDGKLMSTRGELIPVSCDCRLTGPIEEIDLGSFRFGHTATLLADGTVLLAGGFTSDKAVRFNPDL
jgi:hypothetical protein